MPTSFQLRLLLREATFIAEQGSGYVLYTYPFRQIKNSEFQLGDLYLLEPRLCQVLTEIFRVDVSQAGNFRSCSALCGSLLFWERPPSMILQHREVDGTTRQTGILQLHQVVTHAKTGEVGLLVDAYTLAQTAEGLPYAAGFQRQRITVSQALVETQYPGWHERYVLAETLELDPLEKARHASTSMTTCAKVDLAGLTFD